MSKIAVVIPIYKPTLSSAEVLSYQNCLQVLHRYPIVVVKPQKLELPTLMQSQGNLTAVSFEDHYFADVAGYNRLLISSLFYKTFNAFDFILIHQLDAFVFSDSLEEWARKGFDYVGAPSNKYTEIDCLDISGTDLFVRSMNGDRLVLNGGLSLRKVTAMLRFIRIYNLIFPKWTGNEDMLFSLDSTRLKLLKPFIRLPEWKEALHFAFEKSPKVAFNLCNDKLPFGCHAWERYDPEFWKSYISEKSDI